MVMALFTIVVCGVRGSLAKLRCSSLLFHGLASIACFFPFLFSCRLIGMLVLGLWTGIGEEESLSRGTHNGDGS